MKEPARIEDPYPENTLRDDCKILSDLSIRALLSETSLEPDLEDEHLVFDIGVLLSRLHPAAKRARECRDYDLFHLLRAVLSIAAEGRHVGATHFVMTPLRVKGPHFA